jgi:hypothetical protein
MTDECCRNDKWQGGAQLCPPAIPRRTRTAEVGTRQASAALKLQCNPLPGRDRQAGPATTPSPRCAHPSTAEVEATCSSQTLVQSGRSTRQTELSIPPTVRTSKLEPCAAAQQLFPKDAQSSRSLHKLQWMRAVTASFETPCLHPTGSTKENHGL